MSEFKRRQYGPLWVVEQPVESYRFMQSDFQDLQALFEPKRPKGPNHSAPVVFGLYDPVSEVYSAASVQTWWNSQIPGLKQNHVPLDNYLEHVVELAKYPSQRVSSEPGEIANIVEFGIVLRDKAAKESPWLELPRGTGQIALLIPTGAR